jgi:hypothetical protein
VLHALPISSSLTWCSMHSIVVMKNAYRFVVGKPQGWYWNWC